MKLAHWILFVAALLPYVIVATAKARKGYDNADPRNLSQYDGWRRRAYLAHNNAFEAFAFFAVAVLLATYRGAGETFVGIAATVWLAMRILHWFTYVTDRATARSLVWFAGSFATIAIFLAGLFT